MEETEEIEYPEQEDESKFPDETVPEVIEKKGLEDGEMKRFMQIIDGVDPDSSQMMTDFLDMKNIVERTNLLTRKDVQRMLYLDMCAQRYERYCPNNTFARTRDSLARAFLAKGGFKSKQFVELFRNTTDFSSLEVTRDEVKHGILSGVLNRGGGEK